tara:strand:- start:355 stop:723 length:369 start_codon:yes stop_codon:yes gene_type:complete
MTKLYEDLDAPIDEYPNRKGLRNFTWTLDAIGEWEEIWHQLWRVGYKWEWQNKDRYARKYGETYNLFACHDDADRLDMATPLPGIIVIEEVRERLLDDIDDANVLDHLVGAIDRWLKKHYAP